MFLTVNFSFALFLLNVLSHLQLLSSEDMSFDLEVAREAITRVEQDLLKAMAEHLEDGRWRCILNEMKERPFMTIVHNNLFITTQPVDLQKHVVLYWCVQQHPCPELVRLGLPTNAADLST